MIIQKAVRDSQKKRVSRCSQNINHGKNQKMTVETFLPWWGRSDITKILRK
jgi:vacuolar-type H+-ATPase subunit H